MFIFFFSFFPTLFSITYYSLYLLIVQYNTIYTFI